MGVVLAHDVAHHARALVVAAVGPVSAVVHGVDDPAVDRLHAVADIGQGPLHDHGQGIGQIGFPHLLLEVNGLNPLAFEEAVIGVVHLLGAERFSRPVGQVEAVLVRTVVVVVIVCQNRSLAQNGEKGRRPSQASMKRASWALRWMNRRRGSTSSPMSMVKVSSACSASSMRIFLRMRCSGSMVVSQSSW